MAGKTIRLTMAQALVRYLCNQFTTIDGERVPLFAGVFGIFGHGNVSGIGQALQQNPDFTYYQEDIDRVQEIWRDCRRRFGSAWEQVVQQVQVVGPDVSGNFEFFAQKLLPSFPVGSPRFFKQVVDISEADSVCIGVHPVLPVITIDELPHQLVGTLGSRVGMGGRDVIPAEDAAGCAA